MELAPFGVDVLLVQLGAVLSALVDNSKSAQLRDRFPCALHRWSARPLPCCSLHLVGQRHRRCLSESLSWLASSNSVEMLIAMSPKDGL